jgi:acylphosphatase
MPTFTLHITGKVQGVFFRQSAKDKALELGLRGQTWNNADGSVTIVVNGNRTELEPYFAWCRQGPPRAAVLRVEISETTQQDFPDFRIIR